MRKFCSVDWQLPLPFEGFELRLSFQGLLFLFRFHPDPLQRSRSGGRSSFHSRGARVGSHSMPGGSFGERFGSKLTLFDSHARLRLKVEYCSIPLRCEGFCSLICIGFSGLLAKWVVLQPGPGDLGRGFVGLSGLSERGVLRTGGSRTPAEVVSRHSGLFFPGKILHGVAHSILRKRSPDAR
jgi:hypothetical protein